MKKIKIALISLFVCALGYGGYSAYDYVTMTEAERFLLANIEALAIDEPGGGGGSAIYRIEDSDCSVNAVADGEAYITIAGRKFKFSGVSASMHYTKTWSDAARDCYSGGNAMCTTYTCGQFYSSIAIGEK